MKRVKPKLSFERHRQIGKLLHRMRDDLISLYVEVANASSDAGKRKKRAADALNTAQNRIDTARSELEEVMFLDHRDQADTHIYYPGQDGHEKPTVESVLMCAVCQQFIDRTDKGLAMLYWAADKSVVVSEPVLAHKRCVSQNSELDRRLSLSAEIDWFADPEAALDQLTRLVAAYEWDADALRRLCLIICALR